MHSTTVTLLSLVAAASALDYSHPVQRRELQNLVARQTSSGAGADASGTPSDACLNALQSIAPIIQSEPKPPADLASYAVTASVTDYCNLQLPASLQQELSSYESAVSSWAKSNEPAIQSLLSQCPSESSSLNNISANPCSSGGSGGAVGGGSSTSAAPSTSASSGSNGSSGSSGSSSGGSSSAGGSSSPSSHNAGPQQTALAGAAMLAAGFLGAVVAL